MFHYRFSTQVGFSLVEMIVALAVFSIVITTAVGALLMLVATNQQLQAEQSVMTNLSFALDSMTREIRTGTEYFCETANNTTGNHAGGINNIFDNGTDLDVALLNEVRDCIQGRFPPSHRYQGLAFQEGGESITGGTGGKILYFFDENLGKIFRRVGAGDAQSIVSSGIYIVNAEFFVSGTSPLPTGDEAQPAVTIFIEAKENAAATDTYTIQTTVAQRTLDI